MMPGKVFMDTLGYKYPHIKKHQSLKDFHVNNKLSFLMLAKLLTQVWTWLCEQDQTIKPNCENNIFNLIFLDFQNIWIFLVIYSKFNIFNTWGLETFDLKITSKKFHSLSLITFQ
jgi:hypothetical protein